MRKLRKQDQLKGILFGQVIGDALGLGTEFLSKSEIRQLYPNGYDSYDQIVQDKHRARWTKGDWTDDTDQFMCIVDSVKAKNGEFDALDIAERIYSWYANGGMGIGNHTYEVFRMPGYAKRPFDAAKLAWRMRGKKSAPNGALMRNAAIPFLFHQSMGKAVRYSEEQCKLTHVDQRCVDSCVIHTHLILSALEGKELPLQEFLALAKDERTTAYIEQYLTPNIESLQLDEQYGLGYTLKALCGALWAYYYAPSFKAGLLAIINEGGDADTNGCIAAAVLGAKFGYAAIPEEWVRGLNGKDFLEQL